MSFSLQRAIFINRAPFEKLDLKFEDKGVNVLAAINGKGKTTVISHIVDALYELAKLYYPRSFEGKQNKFYRFSSSVFNLDESKYSLVYLRFKYLSGKEENFIDYIDCRGADLTKAEYEREIRLDSAVSYDEISKNLRQEGFLKRFFKKLKPEIARAIFSSNVLTYFPAYRYEEPFFLNDPYKVNLKFKTDTNFKGYLSNPIEVRTEINFLADWMLDVVLDWLVFRDDRITKKEISYEHKLFNSLNYILATTLKAKFPDKKVRFGIGQRHTGYKRLAIMEDLPNNKILTLCPTIFALSSGELAVLSIFGEILRQADNIRLQDFHQIVGMVLIDEVDLHLHIKLQHDVLPLLMNIFPNIQFIVSSHSPFFNMGLAKFLPQKSLILDLDNCGLPSAPSSNSIYDEAYELMLEERNLMVEKLNSLQKTMSSISKPLVITEGKTDIRLILKAKEKLCMEHLDFETVPTENQPNGDATLQSFLKAISKVGTHYPVIGIFDHDNKDIISEVGSTGIKSYGNNVYAFCIPVPEFRKSKKQNNISIEYLFSDEEILHPVDDSGKRLFFGTEFSMDDPRHLSNPSWVLAMQKGRGEERVLENNGKQAVRDENKRNFLAKKVEFVQAIETEYIKISSDSWENFRPILENIEKISKGVKDLK